MSTLTLVAIDEEGEVRVMNGFSTQEEAFDHGVNQGWFPVLCILYKIDEVRLRSMMSIPNWKAIKERIRHVASLLASADDRTQRTSSRNGHYPGTPSGMMSWLCSTAWKGLLDVTAASCGVLECEEDDAPLERCRHTNATQELDQLVFDFASAVGPIMWLVGWLTRSESTQGSTARYPH